MPHEQPLGARGHQIDAACSGSDVVPVLRVHGYFPSPNFEIYDDSGVFRASDLVVYRRDYQYTIEQCRCNSNLIITMRKKCAIKMSCSDFAMSPPALRWH